MSVNLELFSHFSVEETVEVLRRLCRAWGMTEDETRDYIAEIEANLRRGEREADK